MDKGKNVNPHICPQITISMSIDLGTFGFFTRLR